MSDLTLAVDRQLIIINGILRNHGNPGMKLTLIARDPSHPIGKHIIKTDDDLSEVEALLRHVQKHPGTSPPQQTEKRDGAT